MAVNLSENELNYARKKFYGKFYVTKKSLSFFDKLLNKYLIFIYLSKFSIINTKRLIFKILSSFFQFNSKKKIIKFSTNLNDIKINQISAELVKQNYVFVENFLSKDSYHSLLSNWPNINFFKHHKQIIKHFSSGFRYNSNYSLDETFNTVNNSFALKQFYEFLTSNEFKKIYNQIVKFERNSYELIAISSKMAPKGSYLIPHMDGVIKNINTKQHYNFIYFLDGYDENPVMGGATGFYEDNEFKKPIFIPTTIKNSLLIYNQSENFYHGFRAIECPNNIERKSVGFQIKPI